MIVNKDRHIATLTGDVSLEMQLTVERGRGYQPASEQYTNGQEQVVGVIPIDAIFSPVQRVRYRVEATRVGQRTNYDKLILDVWTNGTVTPEMAVVEAAKIMRKHLNPFVQYATAGETLAIQGIGAETASEEELFRKLSMPVTGLELGVRSSNCLESAQVRFVHELVTRTIDDLLQIRAFGKTSLREVEDKLAEHGLSLGMRLPEGFTPTVQA
jgi:DNA-directed RNA polymerase subunit alpha